MKAYKLQEQGMDTVQANIELGFEEDERDYGVGANILMELGLGKLRLITNNPKKRKGLEGYGLKVIENLPIVVEPNEYNRFYLETKEEKMGHFLNLAKYKNLKIS
jgi:3,4-dihydroxy 2-butanone 4-phosphate synthase / GTP cyclohydrolase II